MTFYFLIVIRRKAWSWSSLNLQKRYKCQFCNLSFPTLPQLKVHISIVHTDKIFESKFSEIRFEENQNTEEKDIIEGIVSQREWFTKVR